MYLSLNWLKDFVSLPRSLKPEELAVKLTMHTVEIDGVTREAEKYKNVVVGRILAVKPHPNADKLQLAEVDVKSETLEIVCGAPNIEAGQHVPVALVGAVLPNGLMIKEAEIRGMKSRGMLCAEDELGLGEDHAGIMVLGGKAKIGQPFADYLGVKDVVFEVDNKSITHRPDLWSHYGMAREIAAFLDCPFKAISPAPVKVSAKNKDKNRISLTVKVDDHKLCPRYMAVAIGNIKIEPSPQWLQDRLVAAGTRPINNIVDVTNYVMLELGQPLHAFGASLITRSKTDNGQANILVRKAKKGEKITTLDGVNRDLREDMLLITDGERPIAIAGVMGGENSEVKEDTETVILESANFDHVSIRLTSAALDLKTEAAKRYEKSLDPNLAELALCRAVELIKKILPQAAVVSEIADVKQFTLNQGPVNIDWDWLGKFLGQELDRDRVLKTLAALGFTVIQDDKLLKVSIPTWRATKDISIREDIAEEIARLFGYGNFKPSMPQVEMATPEINRPRLLERRIKTILAGAGLAEVYNYSFVGEDQLKKMGIDHRRHLRLLNPVNRHQGLLRQSLAPNLLLNIPTNQARYGNIRLFEVGSVFLPIEGGINRDDQGGHLPYQEDRLGVLAAGDPGDDVFGTVKGLLAFLLERLNLEVVYNALEHGPNWAEPGQSAEISVFSQSIGTVAKAGVACAKKCGIKKAAAVAELSLPKLLKLYSQYSAKKFREFAKYPPLVRDLAFIVRENIIYNDIFREISDFHEYIRSVELFDVYHGEKLGKSNKSLAFHVAYQADRTLAGDEVDKIQAGLVKHLEDKFEAKVRNF